ncbi:MAG TPA: hypothetical protein VHL80_18975 [Polyangia bacterium]|nr:hypothetical protein [Polyangia bacterium]
MLALVGASLTPTLSGCGKGAKGDCPQLDICGGNPASTTAWQVSEVCQLPTFRPAQPTDVMDFQSTPPLAPTVATPQPNPVVAQQTTSGDWCSGLVFMPGTPSFVVENVNLWHESPHISGDLVNKPSTILLAGNDHSYATTLFLEDQNSTHFAPHCLMQNGAVGAKCSDLASALTAFYTTAALPNIDPTFTNIMCADAPSDGGCDCSYTFNLEVQDQGSWAIDPNDATVLVQDSTVLQWNGTQMNAAASTTTLRSSFCARNGTLQLSGLRGGSLSSVQGLRTLVMTPMQ